MSTLFPCSLLRLAGALLCCLSMAACSDSSETHTAAGDPERGRELLWQFGCGSCHRIEGVVGAVGEVGPPLDGIAHRVYIAGVLANTPENLARWIRVPQEVDPLTAMPNLGVTEEQARDIVAYLHRRG